MTDCPGLPPPHAHMFPELSAREPGHSVHIQQPASHLITHTRPSLLGALCTQRVAESAPLDRQTSWFCFHTDAAGCCDVNKITEFVGLLGLSKSDFTSMNCPSLLILASGHSSARSEGHRDGVKFFSLLIIIWFPLWCFLGGS